MSSVLPFFPESHPDETFLSRVSRYHLLSGNATKAETDQELFGRRVILDFVLPAQALSSLVSRLPGDPETVLQALVQENTLLPAFSPFLGTEGVPAHQELPLGSHYSGLGRLPQRVVGMMHRESRLCVECLREDISKRGIGYWHREHQIPGVQACWRHQKPLLQGCPVCRRPFARAQHLLSVPWSNCPCGWQPANHVSTIKAKELDLSYAKFCACLLASNLPPLKPGQLIRAYRQKITAHGLVRKSSISWTAVLNALQSEFGEEFLAATDPAYRAGQLRSWLRLSLLEGQLELPLTRHVILAMYLFGDFDSFKSCILAQTDEPLEKLRVSKKDTKQEEVDPKLQSMRNKVRNLQVQWPTISLDELWKKSYATADWLYQHDRIWLLQTLQLQTERAPDADGFVEQDATFVETITTGLDNLYDAPGKPSRVTKDRLRAVLPKMIPVAQMKERYPRTSELVDSLKESYWHFILRRLIFGVAEARRLQVAPANSAIRKLSGVHSMAFDAVLAHFNWEPDQMVLPSFDAKSELVRLGINRQWVGPIGQGQYLSGRRYKKRAALL